MVSLVQTSKWSMGRKAVATSYFPLGGDEMMQDEVDFAHFL